MPKSDGGAQCTSIRATNKFELYDKSATFADRYASGGILVNVAEYFREEIDPEPFDGDTYGASATYEVAFKNGEATRLRDTEATAEAVEVPGLGIASNGQAYQVRCGEQEWSLHLGLCTFHDALDAGWSTPNASNSYDLNASMSDGHLGVALGNFPMPKHFNLAAHHDNIASFYSHSLGTLFVLFPIINGSGHTHAVELVRLPIPKEKLHWDHRMEALNGGMGRNFTLCLTPPCERGESELRRMTANTFQAEYLGVLFGHSPRMVMYDDLQVIGLQTDPDVVGLQTGPSDALETPAHSRHALCCDSKGNTVPDCANMAYFRFGVPCVREGKLEADPACTEAGSRGLLPLPNLAAVTTLVDARYSPAMVYTCRPDGAGGIDITASNFANVPDPYCTPVDGQTPPDCHSFENHPSFRMYHIPAANISTEPFLEETTNGWPVSLIVVAVIFGCLVLAVAVVPLLWCLLREMEKHKYQTVA
jgi:hypothetical protein